MIVDADEVVAKDVIVVASSVLVSTEDVGTDEAEVLAEVVSDSVVEIEVTVEVIVTGGG